MTHTDSLFYAVAGVYLAGVLVMLAGVGALPLVWRLLHRPTHPRRGKGVLWL